jgi:Flp pilus assembly protein TadD
MRKHLILVALFGCATSSTARSPRADGFALRRDLARGLVLHHEWKGAGGLLIELAATHPRDPELHALLGLVYREQGLWEEAEQEYKTALQLEPRWADAWAGLGVLRDLRGDPGDQAIEDLKKAVALVPSAPYWNNLGFALYLRGRDTEAIAAYREGLRRDPAARRIRNNLGFAYARLGHLNRAKREFQHGGSDAEVENNLGWALEQGGDRPSACRSYDTAVQLAPALGVAKQNRERVCTSGATASTASTPDETTEPRRLP